MPAGPIGSVWAAGSWSDTAWMADTWADAGEGSTGDLGGYHYGFRNGLGVLALLLSLAAMAS